MPGDVEHLDRHLADVDPVAVRQQPVEIAAAARCFHPEHRAECVLNFAHLRADRDFCAGSRLDQGSAAQMVGVNVGFECPFDGDALGGRGFEHRIDRSRPDFA